MKRNPLVGPTSLALKSLLNLPLAPSSDNKERYNRLIHALHYYLLVFVILTVCVKVGRAEAEHGCFLISQKLLNTNNISLTAAHCAKTLILTSSSGSPTPRQCVRLFIPGVIEFVAKMAPAIQDGLTIESYAAAVG